jgi:hypothetical protein
MLLICEYVLYRARNVSYPEQSLQLLTADSTRRPQDLHTAAADVDLDDDVHTHHRNAHQLAFALQGGRE